MCLQLVLTLSDVPSRLQPAAAEVSCAPGPWRSGACRAERSWSCCMMAQASENPFHPLAWYGQEGCQDAARTHTYTHITPKDNPSILIHTACISSAFPHKVLATLLFDYQLQES